ncbi:hypothetical protein PoB_001071900 [Plakobranchus ocellatus]|uniref:Uncharacterized protein n=1 Tax=Plakobranchus ocellatus TaxID=259542 RepID=A0AAV3YQ07_9GAST|nr:hypothetical protein PoB_001071900 [Plakobranchus ocellatus]
MIKSIRERRLQLLAHICHIGQDGDDDNHDDDDDNHDDDDDDDDDDEDEDDDDDDDDDDFSKFYRSFWICLPLELPPSNKNYYSFIKFQNSLTVDIN